MTDSETDNLDYVKDLPGFDRGNPSYFDNEVIDHLIGIVLELGAELWVVKDRLAHLEDVLENNGELSVAILEEGRPSDARQEKLNTERAAMIQRLYGRFYSKYGGDKSGQKSAI
ncbi:MAG: hypothetical protein ACKVJ2_04650 [Pseudomonadales bacterium]|jgi:hypothetical protein|tara:strand:- start:198 stop:539 length:342 start_codon:yes stop_codon:yes gene_type:complete